MGISHGHKATRRSPRQPSRVGAHRPNRPLDTHSPTACRAARQRPQRHPSPAIAHPGNPQSGARNGAILTQPEPTARHVFPPSPQASSGEPGSPPSGKRPPTHGPTDSTAITATRSLTTTTASTTRASTHPGHTPSWARHRPAPATMAARTPRFLVTQNLSRTSDTTDRTQKAAHAEQRNDRRLPPDGARQNDPKPHRDRPPLHRCRRYTPPPASQHFDKTTAAEAATVASTNAFRYLPRTTTTHLNTSLGQPLDGSKFTTPRPQKSSRNRPSRPSTKCVS